MNVGDYIRIRRHRDNNSPTGIMKIENLEQCINDLFIKINYRTYRKCQIIKSSPQIIDLIEVGDYVNNSKVVDIAYAPKKAIYVEQSWNGALLPILNDRINSVLTKEQFEAMKYKVGD